MTTTQTPKLYPTFVGEWLSRVTLSEPDHANGLAMTGPNPPFFPSAPNDGWLTSIDAVGRGGVQFANEKLVGQFAGDHNQIYFGTWTNDEFGGRTGQFCLMVTVNETTGEPFFVGISETYGKPGSASQAFQVWIGTPKK